MRGVVLVLAAVCTSCVTALAPPLAENAVTGEVVVVRAAQESRAAIDRCVAGEHEMFYGFDLGSSTDSKVALRAVLEPISGPVVRLTTPSGEYVVRERDCETLRVDVQPTGWHINDFRDYAGSVVMDCIAGDAQLRANVRVSACH